MTTQIRKIVATRETILAEMGEGLKKPITRVVGMAVVANPLSGRFVRDLTPLWQIGRDVAEQLAPKLVKLLGTPAISYGKGAIVGVNGDIEHGHACVHPMLGKPMRANIGGGQALIPATVALGPVAHRLDMPLGHKDNGWSFDHFDTIAVMVADAPRPDEIVVALGFADGGRPFPRCGDGPVR